MTRLRVSRQGDNDRPVADRAHPAEQSRDLHRRVQRYPRPVLPDKRSEGEGLRTGGDSRSTSRAAAAKPCEGDGIIKIEMHFLPDVYRTLRGLQGAHATTARPWRSATRERTSYEVLDMTVAEGVAFFANIPKIYRASSRPSRKSGWDISR